MNLSENYGFKLPEASDFYNVNDFNNNAKEIDKLLKEHENKLENGSGATEAIEKELKETTKKLDERIKKNESRVAIFIDSAGLHNGIFRGKNLGSSVTAAQYAAITAGTFEDMYIGDYWVINGITWRIAAFDYWLRCGDTECVKHHIVIVPDSNLYSAQMNATNTTEGGWVGSAMYKSNLAQAKTTIEAAFKGHVLTHREYLTNAMKNGKPSAGAWFDSTVELMNERMVYGDPVFAPGQDGVTDPWGGNHAYTIDKSQLPLFTLAPWLICNRAWYWLRDIVTAASFAIVDGDGNAACNGAGRSGGVRPAFAIFGS